MPRSFTVGDSYFTTGSALNVRGNEMGTPTGETFRTYGGWSTDGGHGWDQHWRMFRATNSGSGTMQIGQIYHRQNVPGNQNTNLGFNIQATVRGGLVGLRNRRGRPNWPNLDDDEEPVGNGLRLADDSSATTGYQLNGYTNIPRLGYVSIGHAVNMDNGASSTQMYMPWFRLHLVHGAALPYSSSLLTDNAEVTPYRPYMRNGVGFSGNSTLFYIGQKYLTGATDLAEVTDSTDVVAIWGNNALEDGAAKYQHFSFRYTTEPGQANAGSAAGLEGLEIMRLRPFRKLATDPIQGLVGIGDWVNSSELPSERLDLLNGKLRIRQLPTDAVSTSTEFVTVNTSTGVLEHRPMATLPDNCEWQMENANYSGPSYQHDVYTAVGSSDACPDATDAVGIGISTPSAKLDVLREPQSGDETGLRVITRSDGNYSGPFAIAYGIIAASQNATGQSPSPQHIGVFGTAQYGSLANHGIYGRAVSSSTYPASNGNHGCRGEAGGQDKCYGLYGYAYGTGPTNYGVYGTAGTGATVNRAGYFAGNLEYTGSLIPPSDQLLKQNIEDLGDALPTLLQLQPKTFQFRTEEYPHMHLATGTQMGLIAQDVAQVLPNLVHDCMHPEEYDTTGTLVHAAVPHLGVDYISLIPLLVASVKEQQAMIQQQQDLITDMQHQLSACCSAGGDGRALPANQGAAGTSTALETDLRVIPNPVAAHTELRYTVGTEGTVRLTITAPDGRTIRTQDEGLRAVGTYSYGWDTTALAPGTYHCTLFVNDELVVRKAVKVAGR